MDSKGIQKAKEAIYKQKIRNMNKMINQVFSDGGREAVFMILDNFMGAKSKKDGFYFGNDFIFDIKKGKFIFMPK